MENLSAEQEQEEIIIKCDIEKMAKTFFKDYEIIWHDPNVNSHENLQYLAQLEKLSTVKTFTERKEAEDYIKTAKKVCHVITSGTNGELLVKEIFSSQNVPSIFTFCRAEDHHSTWTKNYEKVLCTETKIGDVIAQIQKNLVEWQKQTSSFKFDLPVFAPIFDDRDKSQMNHLHHYLKVIPKFNNRIQAKKDFVNLSKGIYTDEENQKLIANFERTYDKYDMEATLKWYTRQSFLYKVINNCLRIATSDSIQYCRLLLKDVEKAIKDQYQKKSNKFSGLLFRGAYLSEEEWLSLKANLNREIEMHGFLSVSKEKQVALDFVRSDPSKKVFITIIVPKVPNEEQGFAEIEEFSDFPNEKEVLFNVRSRFTVLETDDGGSKDSEYRHLVLLHGAQSLRKFIVEENPLQQVSIEDIEDISGSRCQGPPSEMTEKMLFKSLRDLTKPIYSCKGCLDPNLAPFLCVPLKGKVLMTIKGCLLMNPHQTQIPLYGYKCSNCGVKNQKGYFVCTDCCEKKMKWCENCFESSLSCIEIGHSVLLETCPFSFWYEKMSEKDLSHLKFQSDLVTMRSNLFPQVQMYFETHEYEKVIEYSQFYIEQNEAKGKDEKLGASYHNIGVAYNYQGEYNKALESCFKSLDIFKEVSGENHPDISTSMNDIALIYTHQGKYNEALEYHMKSLEMRKLISGEDDPVVATSYSNIAFVYDSQREYKKALENHLKSLDIFKSVYGESHPSIATSFNNIALEYYKQGQYDQAFEYHFKSLDIYKSLHGENHPDVATSYNTIALVYGKQGEYKKALEYYFKSLNINKSIYGENHPSIAPVYNNIATVYREKEEYDIALEYLLKSFNILKSVHGECHPSIALYYTNLGCIYREQREFKKALECYLESLDIFKTVHGESPHHNIAASYNDIALVYQDLEEYNEVLKYSLKYLDILELVDEKNHAEIASSSRMVGMIYYCQGEFEKALEYYLKALDSYEVVCEDNSNVASSCQNIGMVYESQEKYQMALEYYLKSLEAFKSVFGEDNPFTPALIEKIFKVQFLAEDQTDNLQDQDLEKSSFGEVEETETEF